MFNNKKTIKKTSPPVELSEEPVPLWDAVTFTKNKNKAYTFVLEAERIRECSNLTGQKGLIPEKTMKE